MGHFDNWERKGRGVRALVVGKTEIAVTPLLRGWLLTAPEFFWSADTLEELAGVARSCEDHARNELARADFKTVELEEDLGEGFSLRATGGGSGFRVNVSLNGSPVGSYWGFTNWPMATFLLGQETIQGQATLSDVARGRGIGDRMRDAAETVMGLKAVPHGRNFTHGSLSEAAAKSWERRAAARGVPGYGDDIGTKVRKRMLKEANKRVAGALDLHRAFALAEINASPMTIGFIDDTPVCAWVLADDVPIEPFGATDKRHLRELANRFSVSRDEVKFRQMSFRKADAIVDWRPGITDEHRKYAREMADYIASPKLAEFKALLAERPSTDRSLEAPVRNPVRALA